MQRWLQAERLLVSCPMCSRARRLPTQVYPCSNWYLPCIERKARMAELADAFLVLPGGYGTLDELMEVITWAQLGMHAKPCILINTAGYWSGLLKFLDSTVVAGFLKKENRHLLLEASNAADAVRMVARR